MMKGLCERGYLPRSLKASVFVISVLLFACAGPALAQVVSPMQGGHYAPGVINIRDMGHPPPGLFVIWYNLYLSSDKYVDRDGNEFKSIHLSEINPDLPDIDVGLDVDAIATVPALFWGSNFTFLGGARYMAGISPNYVSGDVSVVAEGRGGINDTTVTRTEKGSVSGWSDLFIAPLGLSWGFDQFDATLFYGFYAPTGRYSSGGSDNVGLGFWTHQFQEQTRATWVSTGVWRAIIICDSRSPGRRSPSSSSQTRALLTCTFGSGTQGAGVSKQIEQGGLSS